MERAFMTTLIKKRFRQSLETYDKNAIAQEIMANKLIDLLPQKPYRKILEIGCGTGILTKKISSNFSPEILTINDIVEECEKYTKQIYPNSNFIGGDINKIVLPEKYDLIISNAVFQWFENPQPLINRLMQHLESNGILAFSSFSKENFYEIKELLNIGLNYSTFENSITGEIIELEFKSVSEMLRHIKNTGVNAIENYTLTIGKIDSLKKQFLEKYGKIKLTYHPIFVIIKN